MSNQDSSARTAKSCAASYGKRGSVVSCVYAFKAAAKKPTGVTRLRAACQSCFLLTAMDRGWRPLTTFDNLAQIHPTKSYQVSGLRWFRFAKSAFNPMERVYLPPTRFPDLKRWGRLSSEPLIGASVAILLVSFFPSLFKLCGNRFVDDFRFTNSSDIS